jgi:hypothetical protein
VREARTLGEAWQDLVCYGEATMRVDQCPVCGESLQTPAEFAAHVCPKDDSQGAQALAKIQSSQARQERQNLRPTQENLLKDSAQATREINDAWDGEVEVIVVLIPKGTMNAAWCTNMTDPSKLRDLLKLLWRRSTGLKPQIPSA